MRRLTATAADGFRLSVQVSGLAAGPTLLLLAGQANSHRWWSSLREDFEDVFRVVTFDQRGTGESRGDVTDWSTELFADDARDVLTAVGAVSATVYGTSMGGRVAQVLAAAHPAVVDRLVLACTSPGGPHAQERDAQVRRSLGDPDPGRRRAALQRLFYTDQWPHPPEHSHLFGDPTMSKQEQRAHLRASSRHDAWDRLAQIEAPTLVLHGTDDLMAPVANAHLLAQRIRSARLHLVEGGRHGFFEEHRSQVVPLIRTFLS
ncbi:alpha/beta fold hydrolase [Nocardioides iriomotensis]|uniref:Alpha/beta hydrolase n=1 Tax=Nocardioides iriomotensis TaxID=715784 RepID=A0A4Q5JBU7_9ACTN|nr:alpha/beta hydrolase [Nocardioides iriomotensis]RYU15558.1 alpha/beta hydrolase [Nocardioides iriomotensis]